MNAIQFIKLYGLHSARVTVEDAQENTHYCTETGYHSIKLDVAYEPCPDCVYLSELKRLVESIYLVKEHCMLERAKKYADSPYTAPEIKELLEQAIADYESIYSNDMGDDSHIENHVSPLCKVGGEVIETQSEKLLGLRDEKAELQKRLDGLTQVVEELLEEMKYPTATFEEVICCGVRELEQVLNGGSDE